jgi:hypothetical protein
MIYIVWYNHELMGAFVTMEEAQKAVRDWTDGMHIEMAADFVIRKALQVSSDFRE